MARFDNLSKVIATLVTKDENGVRALLKRNGVDTSTIKTKQELSRVFVESLAKSKGLADDFKTLVESKQYSNAGGLDASSYNFGLGSMSTPKSSFDTFGTDYSKIDLGAGTSSSAEAETNTKKSGFFQDLKANDILDAFTKLIEVQTAAKINTTSTQELANQTANQVAQNQTNGTTPNSPSKSNTGVIILGVVGGLAIITAIIMIAKTKK